MNFKLNKPITNIFEWILLVHHRIKEKFLIFFLLMTIPIWFKYLQKRIQARFVIKKKPFDKKCFQVKNSKQTIFFLYLSTKETNPSIQDLREESARKRAVAYRWSLLYEEISFYKNAPTLRKMIRKKSLEEAIRIVALFKIDIYSPF